MWDLLCGCGGFSQGSVDAGWRVAFACDHWDLALTTHSANHPGTEHRRLELPCAIPFPTDGRHFHVHGSPPCQKFSTAHTKRDAQGAKQGVAEAVDLVEWYLRTALASGASSWSMEQVASKRVVEIVERVRRSAPGRVAYGTFDLHELGVPQTRRRLIAGSPALIARLQRLCSHDRRRSVRDVIPRPRGTHLRHSKGWCRAHKRVGRLDGEAKYVYEQASFFDGAKPVDGPAPTVVCNGDMRWTWVERGVPRRARITVPELAALQTFPPGYKFPKSQHDARMLIGNAVPPLVAQLLLSGAARPDRPASPSLRRPPPALRWRD